MRGRSKTQSHGNTPCPIPELLVGFDGQLVKGIGLAGQMHGLVVLDKDDKVIRPTILWNDGRTQKETDYLNVGQKIRAGKTTLAKLAGRAAEMGKCETPASGRQEYLESVVNRVLFG